ncbi:MAG: peptidase P60, partial [Candidatus Dormibacteraceae bacterium]
MQISLKMPSRMLIVGVIALLLSCLGLMTSVSSAAATTAAPTVAYIDVSVATLWTQPRLNRPVDQPSISNPVDLAAWTKKMTLNQRLDLVGDLETQALYGQRVLITDTSGDWVKVVVPDQSTPRDARGYPGWLPKSQLVTDAAFAAISDHPFAVVTKPTAWLYQDQHRSKRFMELSFNTRLPVLDRSHGSILVATPHEDSKWLAAADSTVYDSESEIPKPTGKDLVRTAKLFTGLPYLWAGMSGWGYDCSG